MHAGAMLGRRFALLDRLDTDLEGVDRWLARDSRLSAEVQVDIVTSLAPTAVRRAVARSAQVRDGRFARVIASGRHTSGGQTYTYLVSERIDGLRLDQVMATKVLPEADARSIVGEAAHALAAAAALDIHHGCLRPAALTVTAAGRVVISGLGTDGELATQAGWGRGRTEHADALALGQLLVQAVTGLEDDEATAADVPESLSGPVRDLCRAVIDGTGPHTLDEVIAATGTTDPRRLRDLRARMGAFGPTPAEKARLRAEREAARRRRMEKIRPDALAAAAARAQAVVAAAHASPTVAQEISEEHVETGEWHLPARNGGARAGRRSGDRAEPLETWDQISEEQNVGDTRSVWERMLGVLHRRWPGNAAVAAAHEQARVHSQRTGPINAAPLVLAGFAVLTVIAVFVALGLIQQAPAEQDPRFSHPPHVYPDPPAEPTPSPSPDE